MTMATEYNKKLIVLEAFNRAFQREVYVLRDRPDILWQQIYNRLRWEEDPLPKVIAPELAERSGTGTAPWVRMVTPFRESIALMRTLAGHSASIHACVFSPDGRFIVSGSDDKTFKFWDSESGQELHISVGAEARVFSPNGRYAASYERYGPLIKLWNVESGKELRTFAGHRDSIDACVFSPDGHLVASASGGYKFGGTLKLWDAESGVELRTFMSAWDRADDRAFNPDGHFIGDVSLKLPDNLPDNIRLRIVVSRNEDGTFKLWDPESGEVFRTCVSHWNKIKACAFSPDGHFIISAGSDHMFKLWDVESGKEIRTFANLGGVKACAFSPDGRFLIAGGEEGTLRFWDVDDGHLVRTLEGHRGTVEACAFSFDGRNVISLSADSFRNDSSMRLWDSFSGKELRIFIGHNGAVNVFALSPDGRFVVSASIDKTLKLWDLSLAIKSSAKKGAELSTFTGPINQINTCAFSPDGRLIVSGSERGTLDFWDAESGANLRTFMSHKHRINTCAFSPDGRFVVSGGEMETLKRWDLSAAFPSGAKISKEPSSSFADLPWVNDCAFSPDGRFIVTASPILFNHDHILTLWDLKSGVELRNFVNRPHYAFMSRASSANAPFNASRQISSAEACAFNPDGRIIVSGYEDGICRVWDVDSGAELRTLEGHHSKVRTCAFSPDGRTIVTAGIDRTIRLWDAESGDELRQFVGHTGSIHACAFSPDGLFIISASDDCTIRFWNVDNGHEIITIGLEEPIKDVVFHPSLPNFAYGVRKGVNVLELVGIRYGPTIVTGFIIGSKTRVRCPACRKEFPLEQTQLGHEITCLKCHRPLRVNKFIVADLNLKKQ
jgi:WD40 repeat protein